MLFDSKSGRRGKEKQMLGKNGYEVTNLKGIKKEFKCEIRVGICTESKASLTSTKVALRKSFLQND